MTTERLVTVEDDDLVRLVGLRRPEVHNAFNHDLVRQILDAIASRPDHVRCLVVFGHGSSFCAGGDRNEGIAGPNGDTLDTLETLQDITQELQRPDLVTIAAVEGWAIGGGAELAVACDFVIAGRSATFRFPEIELATHVTGGTSWLLPRAGGLSRAKYLLLTGTPIDAASAAAWGLVAEVVDEGTAIERSRELATRIASYSPDVLTSMKRSLQQGLHGSLETSLAMEVAEAHPRLRQGGFTGPTA